MGETKIKTKTNHQFQIQIPSCSSNHQISKDIYNFLYNQENNIPITLLKSKSNFTNIIQNGGGGFYDTFSSYMDGVFKSKTESKSSDEYSPNKIYSVKLEEEKAAEEEKAEEEAEDTNSIFLEFNNTKYNIENIKGTKIYYLYLRNGDCARLI